MLVLIALAVGKYFLGTHTEVNPVTDEEKRLPWAPAQDVPLGLQAAPQMIRQHGGEHRDAKLQAFVSQIGNKLVQANAVGDWEPTFRQYRFQFHLLADPETVNAFALPGGQVFFTYGLLRRLSINDPEALENEVAGVLGHEIGHVIGRHSARQMAKSDLVNGVIMGIATGMSDGQHDPRQMAAMVANMVNMKYGRDDESQSDQLGVQFMVNAGYNPEGMIHVMEVLKSLGGGGRQPEFMSTHPDPGNRIEHIRQVIQDVRAGKLEGPKQAEKNLLN